MKYQGKELQSTLQAPNKGELNKLVSSARRYAVAHGMDNFKVLERGKDPDGGYRAIITAHNWNPVTWVKEKIKGRKGKKEIVEEEPTRLLEGTPEESGYEKEDAKEQERFAREEAKRLKEEEERRKKEQERFAEEEAERERKEEEEEYKRREEAFLKSIPPSQRKKVRGQMKGAEESYAEAAVEVLGQGVPEMMTQYYKTQQKEYYTDKVTGEPVPEPRTPEERAKADYHPSQWVYLPVEKKLSAPERLAVARTLELEGMEMGMAREKYKQFKRERHPAYRAAKAAGGLGAFAAGAATMGVAGMARSTQGSRVGRERAARMHAPGVPMDLYAVRPMLGVGIPPARVHTGSGLEHLRALTLPGARRTRTQVRRTIDQVERGQNG